MTWKRGGIQGVYTSPKTDCRRIAQSAYIPAMAIPGLNARNELLSAQWHSRMCVADPMATDELVSCFARIDANDLAGGDPCGPVTSAPSTDTSHDG